ASEPGGRVGCPDRDVIAWALRLGLVWVLGLRLGFWALGIGLWPWRIFRPWRVFRPGRVVEPGRVFAPVQRPIRERTHPRSRAKLGTMSFARERGTCALP